LDDLVMVDDGFLGEGYRRDLSTWKSVKLANAGDVRSMVVEHTEA
jgi:hypothetical protein